jgi:hypothetical protein
MMLRNVGEPLVGSRGRVQDPPLRQAGMPAPPSLFSRGVGQIFPCRVGGTDILVCRSGMM